MLGDYNDTDTSDDTDSADDTDTATEYVRPAVIWVFTFMYPPPVRDASDE
jgi:hypothetical protein